MSRQIVLDTETTGLKPEEGHRVIEIGAIEMIDRKFTGRVFHQYLNPLREIDPGAVAVHGITNQFLSDKPYFEHIAEELMSFLMGAELIIHNAPFDVGFLNAELKLAQLQWRDITEHCNIVDSLQLARKRHVGQKNSLDALCKRYFVDNTKRDYHGALLDANLLAQVYLAMTGGQGSFFDAAQETAHVQGHASGALQRKDFSHFHLPVVPANAEESDAHLAYLDHMSQKGECLWSQLTEKTEHELTYS